MTSSPACTFNVIAEPDTLAGNATAVREHYNKLGESTADRNESDVLSLRQYNNWVKSVLLQESGVLRQPGGRVLDLCGGRGGDLPKFGKSNVRLVVAVDVSDESLRRYTERHRLAQERPRAANLELHAFAGDCGAVRLSESGCYTSLDSSGTDIMFDLVNCQFSIHYMFETEAKARQMMQNITERLRVGGMFVCTLPCAERLVHRAREEKKMSGVASFGNSVFRIAFPSLSDESESVPLYGAAYEFSLTDAVDSCAEYLVHLPTFVALAREYNLELVSCDGFHELFLKHATKYADLLRRMRVFGTQRISDAEWEVIGLYQALSFRKV